MDNLYPVDRLSNVRTSNVFQDQVVTNYDDEATSTNTYTSTFAKRRVSFNNKFNVKEFNAEEKTVHIIDAPEYEEPLSYISSDSSSHQQTGVFSEIDISKTIMQSADLKTSKRALCDMDEEHTYTFNASINENNDYIKNDYQANATMSIRPGRKSMASEESFNSTDHKSIARAFPEMRNVGNCEENDDFMVTEEGKINRPRKSIGSELNSSSRMNITSFIPFSSNNSVQTEYTSCMDISHAQSFASNSGDISVTKVMSLPPRKDALVFDADSESENDMSLTINNIIQTNDNTNGITFGSINKNNTVTDYSEGGGCDDLKLGMAASRSDQTLAANNTDNKSQSVFPTMHMNSNKNITSSSKNSSDMSATKMISLFDASSQSNMSVTMALKKSDKQNINKMLYIDEGLPCYKINDTENESVKTMNHTVNMSMSILSKDDTAKSNFISRKSIPSMSFTITGNDNLANSLYPSEFCINENNDVIENKNLNFDKQNSLCGEMNNETSVCISFTSVIHSRPNLMKNKILENLQEDESKGSSCESCGKGNKRSIDRVSNEELNDLSFTNHIPVFKKRCSSEPLDLTRSVAEAQLNDTKEQSLKNNDDNNLLENARTNSPENNKTDFKEMSSSKKDTNESSFDLMDVSAVDGLLEDSRSIVSSSTKKSSADLISNLNSYVVEGSEDTDGKQIINGKTGSPTDTNKIIDITLLNNESIRSANKNKSNLTHSKEISVENITAEENMIDQVDSKLTLIEKDKIVSSKSTEATMNKEIIISENNDTENNNPVSLSNKNQSTLTVNKNNAENRIAISIAEMDEDNLTSLSNDRNKSMLTYSKEVSIELMMAAEKKNMNCSFENHVSSSNDEIKIIDNNEVEKSNKGFKETENKDMDVAGDNTTSLLNYKSNEVSIKELKLTNDMSDNLILSSPENSKNTLEELNAEVMETDENNMDLVESSSPSTTNREHFKSILTYSNVVSIEEIMNIKNKSFIVDNKDSSIDGKEKVKNSSVNTVKNESIYNDKMLLSSNTINVPDVLNISCSLSSISIKHDSISMMTSFIDSDTDSYIYDKTSVGEQSHSSSFVDELPFPLSNLDFRSHDCCKFEVISDNQLKWLFFDNVLVLIAESQPGNNKVVNNLNMSLIKPDDEDNVYLLLFAKDVIDKFSNQIKLFINTNDLCPLLNSIINYIEKTESNFERLEKLFLLWPLRIENDRLKYDVICPNFWFEVYIDPKILFNEIDDTGISIKPIIGSVELSEIQHLFRMCLAALDNQLIQFISRLETWKQNKWSAYKNN